VPAVTCTGEVTVAPFAGVQIVTDGDAGFSAQGAAEATAAKQSKIVRRVRKMRAEEGNGPNNRIALITGSRGNYSANLVFCRLTMVSSRLTV
jgi:hypothetical protein